MWSEVESFNLSSTFSVRIVKTHFFKYYVDIRHFIYDYPTKHGVCLTYKEFKYLHHILKLNILGKFQYTGDSNRTLELRIDDAITDIKITKYDGSIKFIELTHGELLELRNRTKDIIKSLKQHIDQTATFSDNWQENVADTTDALNKNNI